VTGARLLCEVFAGSRRDGCYLFVREEEGLARVPAALLASFGTPRSVMTLELDLGRQLAQASAERVLESIVESGFYLQLPPGDRDYATPGDAADGQARPQGPELTGGGEAC
jgi:uncharacterized protein YcgL (UPF0745 family)